MKIKRFAAAALAAMMVMSMAACGNTKDSGSDSKAAEETTTTAAAAAEGEESKAEEEKPAETEKAAEETTAETEKAEEEKPAETEKAEEEKPAETEKTEEEKPAETEKTEEETPAETEKGWKDGVFNSELYSIEVDESTWKEMSQAGVDCMFQYNGETTDPLDASASFNVVAMQNSSLKGVKPSDYIEQIEKVYSAMDGFSKKESGSAKLGDEDVVSTVISYNMGVNDATMTITLLLYSDDDKIIAFTYGAIDSVMEKMQPEFDKVIKSFKVKK